MSLNNYVLKMNSGVILQIEFFLKNFVIVVFSSAAIYFLFLLDDCEDPVKHLGLAATVWSAGRAAAGNLQSGCLQTFQKDFQGAHFIFKGHFAAQLNCMKT